MTVTFIDTTTQVQTTSNKKVKDCLDPDCIFSKEHPENKKS